MCEVIPDSVDNVDGLVAKLWKMTMLETTPYINVRFADWILGQRGGQLGAKLEPSWDQKSNKIGPKSDPKCDHSSKMLQKSTQIGPKAFLERSGGHLQALGSILDRFWLDLGAKLEPSWL